MAHVIHAIQVIHVVYVARVRHVIHVAHRHGARAGKPEPALVAQKRNACHTRGYY